MTDTPRKSILADPSGKPSLTRIAALCTVLAGCAIGLLALLTGAEQGWGMIGLSFVGAGLTGKIAGSAINEKRR